MLSFNCSANKAHTQAPYFVVYTFAYRKFSIGVNLMNIPSFNQWFEAHYYHLVRGWYHEMFADESFIEYAQDIYNFTFDLIPVGGFYVHH